MPSKYNSSKLQPGQLMADGSVYIGHYQRKSADGKALSKVFNVFVAPEDLPEPVQYKVAVEQVAALKNWHGHNGEKFTNAQDIQRALRSGTYKGGWIIPPREILSGDRDDAWKVRRDKIINPDNMLDHQNDGALRDTFKKNARGGTHGAPQIYWSSSRNTSSFLPGGGSVWTSRFDEMNGTHYYQGYYFSCRPVRLVKCSL